MTMVMDFVVVVDVVVGMEVAVAKAAVAVEVVLVLVLHFFSCYSSSSSRFVSCRTNTTLPRPMRCAIQAAKQTKCNLERQGNMGTGPS